MYAVLHLFNLTSDLIHLYNLTSNLGPRSYPNLPVT
jgi:hypothetical protein